MVPGITGTSERRQSPRYDIELSADIVLSDDTILTVTTRNISSNGIQVACDSWVTDTIEPRGIQSHAINHVRLKVIVEIPIGNEKEKLYADCRIISVQRLSQEEFTLNLAFVGFENGSEKTLDAFVDQHQQRKTVIKTSA